MVSLFDCMARSSLTRRLVRAAAATAAAAAVAAASESPAGRRADRRLLDALNGPTPRRLDAVATGVTELGSIWAAAAAAAVLAAGGRRRPAASALCAAAAMWAVGQGAKRVMRRPRPYESPEGSRLITEKPNGTSWPSSHPATLYVFVTVAGTELGLRPAARLGLSSLCLVVGASRPAVGVHYPSDVAGGLLLARATADAWLALDPFRRTARPR